ncbi:hypothetical protein BGZ65_011054, partial [Modicella reniformis]
MIFGSIVPSPRGILSAQQSLELANVYLENANRVPDNDIALVLCHDTELSLSQAKKSAKREEDKAVSKRVATAYIELGKVLNGRGHHIEAKASYKKAEKLGVNVNVHDQAQLAPYSDPKSAVSSAKDTLNSDVDPMVKKSLPLPSRHLQKRPRNIAVVSQLIFEENVRPPTIKLPEADERLVNTPQLACCLSLLRSSHSLDDTLEPIARNWIQAVENDLDEQERLKLLVTDVIRIFKNDEHKDAKAIAEVVCLSPALEKEAFRGLLIQFYAEITKSN